MGVDVLVKQPPNNATGKSLKTQNHLIIFVPQMTRNQIRCTITFKEMIDFCGFEHVGNT